MGSMGGCGNGIWKSIVRSSTISCFISGKLFSHLQEIDRVSHERMEMMVGQMAKAEGVTERMKAENQIEWVQRMNSIRNRAEEIILDELIYN